MKEASVVGVWWGTWAAKNPKRQIQNMLELAKLVKKGELRPRVTESHSLDDFEKAFLAITERRALGKVVLTMT